MPTMPAKGLDRFVDTLTWKKALRDAEREHRARYEGRNAKRRAKGEEVLPYQALKPTRQVSYLHYLERGLSLMLVVLRAPADCDHRFQLIATKRSD